MAVDADRRRRLASAAVGRRVLDVTADSVRVVPETGLSASPTLVEAALDWIDDPVGLLDERPVAVADIWRSLMVALLGPRCESVLVVHPPDWPRQRINRVIAAANTVADHVEAVSRDSLPGDHGPTAVGDAAPRCEPPGRPIGRLRQAAAIAAALAVCAIALTVRADPQARSGPTTTVVEGRMSVRIPAHWNVARVTGGPGSRRLQVSDPGRPGVALHLTSSYAPESTLDRAAAVLRAAIAQEPAGVFVDVRSPDRVAGRPAVTYRELRPGRVIAWSVVIAGSTRVSIGCQSPVGRESDIRAACEEAVRSARET